MSTEVESVAEAVARQLARVDHNGRGDADAFVDAEWKGWLDFAYAAIAARARKEHITLTETERAVMCRFDGIGYTAAELAVAQRAACAIVPLYGTGDHGEQEAALAGKLWNDHPAVQGALRALHEDRVQVKAGESGR